MKFVVNNKTCFNINAAYGSKTIKKSSYNKIP
jgi:hypothetical protein